VKIEMGGTVSMLTLILCLAAPIAAAPLLVIGSRHLFANFVRETAAIFHGLDMHRAWAMTLGTDVAIINILIFALGWWGAVALSSLNQSAFLVAMPFILALLLALWITRGMIKARLKLPSKQSWLVGLISFAGGNLPLILGIPVLLMIVLTHASPEIE
jgi:hypothetical protein